MKTPRPTKKWLKQCESYKYFSKDWESCCSYTEEDQRICFLQESQGYVYPYTKRNEDGKYNGYLVGKHWMDVNLSMWREDMKDGMLYQFELIEDPEIPDVVKKKIEKFEQGWFTY